MRKTGGFVPKMFATFCLAVSIAAGTALGVCSRDGATGRLGTEEMQTIRGLQTEDYECFEDAGCCQGLQCGMCPDCNQCTNDGPPIGTCQGSWGMTCTELSNHDCGDLVQGFCCDDCEECGESCQMGGAVVVGSCGSISQCE